MAAPALARRGVARRIVGGDGKEGSRGGGAQLVCCRTGMVGGGDVPCVITTRSPKGWQQHRRVGPIRGVERTEPGRPHRGAQDVTPPPLCCPYKNGRHQTGRRARGRPATRRRLPTRLAARAQGPGCQAAPAGVRHRRTHGRRIRTDPTLVQPDGDAPCSHWIRCGYGALTVPVRGSPGASAVGGSATSMRKAPSSPTARPWTASAR